jgi:uncharacterized protein (TIGR02271 family)
MTTNVVGLFDSFDEAERAVRDIADSGVRREDISIVANDAEGNFKNYRTTEGGTQAEEGAATGAVGGGVIGGVLGLLAGVGALAIPGIGPVIAAGPLAAAIGSAGAGTLIGAAGGAATGGLVGGLIGLGIPDEDAHVYAEGIRRGGALVSVNTSDDRVDMIAGIMQRHGVVDIDERASEWRGSGWDRFDERGQPYTSDEINSFRTSRGSNVAATGSARSERRTMEGDEAVLPVVEEELQVGKRQVQRGGVRVHTVVEERPVEEQVNLREERVHVERRPVDRPVADADMNAFRETSFEVTETAEEAVVQKRARVIEEVVVHKDVEDRTETIRDTVRRQDVHVHEEGAERAVGTSGFDDYDRDFRTHFGGSMANSGYSYDQYRPVYRYGYDLAADRRYAGRDWSAIETDARRSWEERNPGTWDEFKDSVRYAWDRARGQR